MKNLMNKKKDVFRIPECIINLCVKLNLLLLRGTEKLTKDLDTFQIDIQSYPLFTCDRLFYPDGVSLSSANNLLANLYRFHTTCPLPSLPLEERVYGYVLYV